MDFHDQFGSAHILDNNRNYGKSKMKNILEIDGLILEFNSRRVLHDVYFKVETGRITGLLGRNGTGKSCLMKILFGDLNPAEKSIRINGQGLFTSWRSPEDMRYLPQKGFIPSHIKVSRIFSEFNLDFDDLIQNFPELNKFYHSKLGDLSGGERRIVEIYTILASHTKFCMLDEPFSQVMPIHIDAIKQLILREKSSKGIIVTDHMYQHIVDICDDLYVISNGKTHLTKSLEDIERLGYMRMI